MPFGKGKAAQDAGHEGCAEGRETQACRDGSSSLKTEAASSVWGGQFPHCLTPKVASSSLLGLGELRPCSRVTRPAAAWRDRDPPLSRRLSDPAGRELWRLALQGPSREGGPGAVQSSLGHSPAGGGDSWTSPRSCAGGLFTRVNWASCWAVPRSLEPASYKALCPALQPGNLGEDEHQQSRSPPSRCREGARQASPAGSNQAAAVTPGEPPWRSPAGPTLGAQPPPLE